MTTQTRLIETERTGTGTREWSDHSCNIALGCAHDCRYCYARSMAVRFGRATAASWPKMRVDKDKVKQAGRLKDGVVMFPTTHDIHPDILPACVDALLNMASAGNRILVVSKPHPICIKVLCDELEAFKNQVEFRFTMGSPNNDTLRLWEPGAPSLAERMASLQHAFESGYSTSVSMEPMLDSPQAMIGLAATVDPWVTRTIWLGKLNKPNTRIVQADAKLEASLCNIREWQSDENIMRVVTSLGRNRKIRWKDSIKEVIARNS